MIALGLVAVSMWSMVGAGIGPAAAITPVLTTTASPTTEVGGPIFDNANLLGASNPTGTITFNLYGPGDPTCSGPPIFTSTVPVTGTSVNSASFSTTQAGTHRWTASYSGDANHDAVGPTPCNDPAEAVIVDRADAVLSTVAAPLAGGTIHDTATLSGGFNPTGTLTFDLHGPGDTFCSGAPVFTSTVPVAGNGVYQSGNFTPTVSGTYRWRATYSGDPNNQATGPTPCLDPAETVDVVVAPTPLTLTTTASPGVTVGGQVRDTATLAGGTNPTGTITFNLYGPNDATCTGVPAFISTVPVSGSGSYDSANFTPTAPGTYRWVAAYSGDANNAAVSTACNDPAETVVVTAPPTTLTLTTAASAGITLGGQIFDTATLAGGTNPTGTVTFTLYGPNDATCSATPAFTSTKPVTGNGSLSSDPFTPTLPGTYRWVAAYSGDASNAAASTACNDPAETVVVTFSPVGLSISVSKTATPSSLPEPGGTFTFTVVVTNTSTVPATVTALSDDVYGDLDGLGSCAVGAPLAVAGSQYTCSFPGTFTGNAGASQTDTVTATAAAVAGIPTTTAASATVTLTDVAPTATVTKTATPATLAAPGGSFAFTVTVTNTGPEPVQLTGLVDDVYGDLNGQGTCVSGAVPIAAGGTVSCTFAGSFTGSAGQSQTDTVTATVADDEGNTSTLSDSATVSIIGALPVVTVDQTVDSQAKPEPGGTFTSSITVTNASSEPVTLESLVDEDLNGKGTCRLPQTLAGGGGTYSCTFPIVFTGDAGDSRVFTTTATVVDALGRRATGTDSITLTITDALPAIGVVKTADPPTRPAPGGSFTFGVAVTNTSPEPVTLEALVDDVYGDLAGRGTCTVRRVLAVAATYACSFVGRFDGVAGARQTDTVSATATDDEDNMATASASASVALTTAPTTGDGGGGGGGGGGQPGAARQPSVTTGSLARTGTGLGVGARMAVALVIAGFLLVAGSRTRHVAPAAGARSPRTRGAVGAWRSYVAARRRRSWGIRRQWPPHR